MTGIPDWDIHSAIERSSLGTPAARRARATVPTAQATKAAAAARTPAPPPEEYLFAAPLVVPPWLLEWAAAEMGMTPAEVAGAFNAVASEVVPRTEFSLTLLGREYAASRKPAGPGLILRRL